MNLKNKQTKPSVILNANTETLFSLPSSNYYLVIHRVEKQVFEIIQNEGSILFPLKAH